MKATRPQPALATTRTCTTRAGLLRRLGRADDARAAYRQAIDLTRSDPERRLLERRITEL